MKNKVLVFGCSGTVGSEFINTNKNKNILFYSRKKPKKLSKKYWRYVDLDKKIDVVPSEAEKIFFFSSPYYNSNNLKRKKFLKELNWLKKLTKKTRTNIFVYLSSSSVYLKDHPVGNAKLKCEKFLTKSLSFNYLQIWRPFNLIGDESLNLSDHFHNILIKNFYIKNKKSHHFLGSEHDERGYSSAKKFCKFLINKSESKKNFLYNYGNSNTIKVSQIAKIFKNIFESKFKKKIEFSFKTHLANINTIKTNKNIKTFNSKEKSYNIIKKYYLLKLKSYEKQKL